MTPSSLNTPLVRTPSQPVLMVEGDDPRAEIWKAIQAVYRFPSLYAMARFDLAGLLKDGPRTAADLAAACGVRPDQLTRVLRALVAMGFLDAAGQDGAGAYALNERGAVLLSDEPGSMRWAILSTGEPGSWNAMSGIVDAVRDGVSPFVVQHGSMYGYLEGNPEAASDFDAFMASRSSDAANALVGAYDFAGVRTVTDVGGGTGIVLSTVMAAHPQIHGTLLDLEHVVERAEPTFRDRGLADRCTFAPGDYFAQVPAGADVYVLSNIVHNLDRADAVRLLRNVRAAMREDSRVLALDILLPDDGRAHFGFDLNIRMMALFPGGEERDRGEYEAVLREAGLHVTDVIALPGTPLSAVEAVPGPA
ncbi:hydroxyneurosporene methyltransferase [Actinomadura sp. LD22]|uniref:Hydroxyneurosporene methyltransferase n=1 Tax=Actinomadura physcomitrii TaxID=2650748 RepID=A0A6I4MDR1_9ACTN|nr:methyltransferase [Actinomadura physcomitrii]MWA02665.1 hydroxyneurosporene methyltransferase [Actinomadura physcomitrii]